MYDGYIKAFKELFCRKIKVVIDRLQVAKHYRSRLDTLRKHELKRLLQTQMSHIEGWNQGVKSSFDKFIDQAKIVALD
jgi:hypothetical protein